MKVATEALLSQSACLSGTLPWCPPRFDVTEHRLNLFIAPVGPDRRHLHPALADETYNLFIRMVPGVFAAVDSGRVLDTGVARTVRAVAGGAVRLIKRLTQRERLVLTYVYLGALLSAWAVGNEKRSTYHQSEEAKTDHAYYRLVHVCLLP